MSVFEEQPTRFEQIDELIQQLESSPDERTRDVAIELVQLVMELHRVGLQQILKNVQQIVGNEGAIVRLAEDDWIAGLLLLHNLHPHDLSTRVTRALEQVRPYLKSHGGDVELLEIHDGVIRLRLEGSCHGCPSSEITLKTAIEEAINRFAPDHAGLHVEGIVHSRSTDLFPSESLVSLALPS